MTIEKSEDGEPLRKISSSGLVELDALAFASKADGGEFAIIGYFRRAPVAIFPFHSSEDAIDFANMILQKTRS